MLNKQKKLSAVTKVFFIAAMLTFVACVKSTQQAEVIASNKQDDNEKSTSVSIVNGKYFVDRDFISRNKNKKPLLADLNSENLLDKKNKEEIPYFIKAFLDSITNDKKFEIANPGEEWRIPSITDFAYWGVIKVSGNENKHVETVSPQEGSNLPTKQLVYFGIGKNIALLSYHTGGLTNTGGMRMLQNMTILKFHNDKVVDFWYGSYSDFAITKAEILKRLNSPRQDGC